MILSQILRRILRSLRRPYKEKVLPSFSAGLLVGIFLLSSCTSTKTVPIESLRHDTLYVNKEHYDSIYIDNSHLIDRGSDTVFIKDKLIEYRFRLLRDTIYKTRIDSIPYEVRITDVKEVPRPRNLFDYISYVCFGLIIGGLVCKGLKYSPIL